MTVYEPEEYGAHPQVFGAELLPDGRIAFGAGSYLLIYDGESFVKRNIGSGRQVNSMDVDEKGRLFLGGIAVMGYMSPDSNGRLEFFSLKPLLSDSSRDFGQIWNTWCGPKGGVYFNARDKLYYYKDGEGLYQYERGRRNFFENSDPLTKGIVRSILPKQEKGKDEWLVFTEKRGVFQYDPKKEQVGAFSISPGVLKGSQTFRDLRVHTVCSMDPKENPYKAAYAVGTIQSGIYFLTSDGQVVLHISKEEGLPSELIWDIEKDRRGNLWAATNDGIALLHTEPDPVFLDRGLIGEDGGLIGKGGPFFLKVGLEKGVVKEVNW